MCAIVTIMIAQTHSSSRRDINDNYKQFIDEFTVTLANLQTLKGEEEEEEEMNLLVWLSCRP